MEAIMGGVAFISGVDLGGCTRRLPPASSLGSPD